MRLMIISSLVLFSCGSASDGAIWCKTTLLNWEISGNQEADTCMEFTDSQGINQAIEAANHQLQVMQFPLSTN